MGTRLAICSIISRNRLAYARTLNNSFRELYPDTPCYVLAVDGCEGFFEPAQEIFNVLRLEELGIPDLDSLRFKYTPFELCCALKPFLLEHLLKSVGVESVLYFDTDMLILSHLDDLLSNFQTADILLTPHLDQDLPKDGKKPDDGHVLLSGIFNGGFVGVAKSQQADEFLRWWKGKLYDHCIEDHFNGYFVDQKFLDLAIGLFDRLGIVRHPGCNVAYWNLHSRAVSRAGNSWFANEQPLLFYHFSDYSLNEPNRMSGHQNRFELNKLADLKSLFDLYRTSLMANGYETSIKWSYEFGFYRNGKAISKGARRAFLLNPWVEPGIDPFDSSKHSFGFRAKSLYQSLRLLMNRLALKFLRRPQQ